MRIFLTLLVALIWGIGSWWWYTCKVKGFCGNDTTTAPVAETVAPPPIDTDNDGLPDAIEQALGLNSASNDSDQDGLNDSAEVGDNKDQAIDSDGDGTINALDDDDDNDGISTQNELADSNGDGDPADAVDTDKDGIANYLDTDSDGDGISDADETRLNLNPLTSDSDGDGIDDSVEIGDDINTPKDSDGDGIIDALDTEDTPTQAKESATESTEATSETMQEPTTDAGESASDSEGNTTETTETSTEAAAEPVTDTEKTTTETSEEAVEKPEEAVSSNEDQVSVDTVVSDTKATIDAANIYFPFRSANPQLSEDAKNYFEKVVTALKADSELKISLIGHTDNIGSTSGNEKLGLARAKIIKQTLVDQGAPSDQIDTSSQGEASPIASNDTQDGRDKNRRVELLPQ